MVWVKRIAFAVLAVVVLAAATIYGVSEWKMRRDVGVPLTPFVADASPAGITEGKRLAAINGCTICHAGGHGNVFLNAPPFVVIDAPAFAVLATESDAQIARSTRQGVGADGRQLYFMPPHATIANDDLARILGFLRSVPPAPGDLGRRRDFGPLGRLAVATGGLPGTPHPPLAGPARRPVDSGAYFAETVCLGCHRLDAPNEIRPGDVAPPLTAMAAAYDDVAFTRLLRTGTGLSGTNLGLMREVSREGLSQLTDAEIAGIHAYLRAKAGAQ